MNRLLTLSDAVNLYFIQIFAWFMNTKKKKRHHTWTCSMFSEIARFFLSILLDILQLGHGYFFSEQIVELSMHSAGVRSDNRQTSSVSLLTQDWLMSQFCPSGQMRYWNVLWISKESFKTTCLPDIYQEMFPMFKSGFLSPLFPHSSTLEIGKCTVIKVTQFPLK